MKLSVNIKQKLLKKMEINKLHLILKLDIKTKYKFYFVKLQTHNYKLPINAP